MRRSGQAKLDITVQNHPSPGPRFPLHPQHRPCFKLGKTVIVSDARPGIETMFDDSFIDNLPEDPFLALEIMCNHFAEFNSIQEGQGTVQVAYYDYIAALGLLRAFLEANDLAHEYRVFETYYALTPAEITVESVREFFESAATLAQAGRTRQIIEEAKTRYSVSINKTFVYEFSEDDFSRIQTLINELRTLISESTLFEEDHKSRLLKRLEKLQAELHKKESNLDKFWGLIGEAGVALGKFGTDAKPLVDRIHEIAAIIWRIQATAEGLPIKEFPEDLPRLLGPKDRD